MSATNDFDRERLKLEDIIALVLDARDDLFPPITRLAQRARTEDEAADLMQLLAARRSLEQAHGALLRFHPDALGRGK